MRERELEAPTKDGPMTVFVTHPEDGGPFPAVIIYLDIWGVREELRDIARRIASTGYYVAVPDLFHREPSPVSHDFRDAQGRVMSLDRLSPELAAPVLQITSRLSNEMAVEDTAALLQFMENEPVQRRQIGAIGYCMGGRHALCVAARFPDQIKAAISLHGSGLITERPDSPHLGVARIQAEVYCGYASDDPYAAPELVAQLDSAFERAGVVHRSVVHPGTRHGYALPDRDIYAKQAAERDWELIFALLHRRMPAFQPH